MSTRGIVRSTTSLSSFLPWQERMDGPAWVHGCLVGSSLVAIHYPPLHMQPSMEWVGTHTTRAPSPSTQTTKKKKKKKTKKGVRRLCFASFSSSFERIWEGTFFHRPLRLEFTSMLTSVGASAATPFRRRRRRLRRALVPIHRFHASHTCKTSRSHP